MAETPASPKGYRIAATTAFLVLGIVYLVLVILSFMLKIDLERSVPMQAVLHGTLVVTAVTYVVFSEAVYRNNTGDSHALLFLIFSSLFSVPVLIGRALGLYALSFPSDSAIREAFNFYGAVSVSRTVELLSWTILFPASTLMLSFMFLKRRTVAARSAGAVELFSSLCCFIAFFHIAIPEMYFLFVGVTGWGILQVVFLSMYLRGLVTERIDV